LGALVAFINYAQRFYQPIQDLTEKYNTLQDAMAASERIFKLLDTEKFVPETAKPIEVHELKGDIEFKDVWFAYNEDYVLKDISFKVEQGESVAFVGATGAGKTTIINLLSRFYEPNKGTILVDGINIKNISIKNLRKNIGVVLQDVFLFSGDIAYNISLGDEDIDFEKVRSAAIEVNIENFIKRFPNGYKEDIRERGGLLSFGQRQLLAFARALVYDPKILALDEATSNIDTDTELLIQKAVKKLMKNRTSIIIAHRLSTIQNVNKIIVIHKGRIREMGTHQELLALKGIYYKLYLLQYKDQEKIPVYSE
jgi:ABC-type multidrug transport system fused ATPase/permease subunit